MTSHSSRVRELKKSKSGGKMSMAEDENRAPISKAESNNEKLVDEDLTKYTVNELRDKLKVPSSPAHAPLGRHRGWLQYRTKSPSGERATNINIRILATPPPQHNRHSLARTSL